MFYFGIKLDLEADFYNKDVIFHAVHKVHVVSAMFAVRNRCKNTNIFIVTFLNSPKHLELSSPSG